MTMTDGEALLKAIIAEPSDDTPRLVYSDWLEENGQLERAKYIRLAIEYARLTDGWKWENLTCLDIYLDPQDCEQQSWKHEVWKMQERLNELEKSEKVFLDTVLKIHSLVFDYRIQWWRGFPIKIQLTWENWLKHHERLRNLIPLEEVELTSYSSLASGDLFVIGKGQSLLEAIHEFPVWKGIKFNFGNNPHRFQTHSGD